MVEKGENEIFAIWSDSEESEDPKLKNLINDIIRNRLPLNAWDTVKGEGLMKKGKRKVDVKKSENDFVEDDESEMSKKKKMQEGNERSSEEDNEEGKITMSRMAKMIEKLIGTVENLNEQMKGLETKVERIVQVQNDVAHSNKKKR